MASTVKYLSVYRMALKGYISKNDGGGSFKYGGRWTPKVYRAIYTSASRSLCFYEFMVNNNIGELPEDLFSIEIRIPQILKTKKIKAQDLPKDWKKPFSIQCKQIGQAWLTESKSSVLIVPSAGFDEEFNYILNPEHADFKKIKFMAPKKFLADERVLRRLRKE